MIKFNDVSFKYDHLQILKNFNISFEDNTITCLLGPSGVGKTTIVNMVTKLIYPDEGYITGIENAMFSYIFQEPRLLDWYSVYDNIDFVIKDMYDVEERKRIINDYITTMGLSNYQDYKPSKLSGGMAQRVSIARALAYPSNILIMDEPFKGLDLKLKQEIISTFQKLWLKSKRTVIFITHDINEAVSLSHTIYLLGNRPVKIIKKYENILEQDKTFIKKDLKNHLEAGYTQFN